MNTPKENDKKLWIIDIDGTIANVHSNQVPAWTNMMKDVYGVDVDESTLVSYFGKPFTSVLVDVLGHFGVAEAKVMEHFDRAFDGYVQGVQQGLEKNGGEVLPGAIAFLDALGEQGAVRAIATGNPEEEAEHKLKYLDLRRYFDITVYAEDRRERFELVEEVLRQAKETHGVAVGEKQFAIIGDSPHDIESGKRFGALSIGVATGTTSKEVLAQKQPDLIFDSIADYEKIIAQATRAMR